MKMNLTILFVLSFLSCSDSVLQDYGDEDCVWHSEDNRIFDKGESFVCNTTNVYRYKGHLYSHFYCCLCAVQFPVVDCDGNNIAGDDVECIENFFVGAEYLYSFE